MGHYGPHGQRKVYLWLSTVNHGNGVKVTRSLRRTYYTNAPPLPPRTYKLGSRKQPLAIKGYFLEKHLSLCRQPYG